MEAHKHGDTVHVTRGTRVREVSDSQLQEEINALSDAGIDDEMSVKAKLRSIKRKYQGRSSERTHLLQEIVGSLTMLIEEEN